MCEQVSWQNSVLKTASILMGFFFICLASVMNPFRLPSIEGALYCERLYPDGGTKRERNEAYLMDSGRIVIEALNQA
jgi:hypothetical protein